MKSKLFGVISVSLVSSIWLTPTQGAFAHSVEFQTPVKESQVLLNEMGSRQSDSSALTGNQAVVREAQATTESKKSLAVAAAFQTAESSQPNSPAQTVQESNTLGGLFVIFVFTGYILAGLQYRRYRANRTAVLLRQIEALERIWKMKPYR